MSTCQACVLVGMFCACAVLGALGSPERKTAAVLALLPSSPKSAPCPTPPSSHRGLLVYMAASSVHARCVPTPYPNWAPAPCQLSGTPSTAGQALSAHPTLRIPFPTPLGSSAVDTQLALVVVLVPWRYVPHPLSLNLPSSQVLRARYLVYLVSMGGPFSGPSRFIKSKMPWAPPPVPDIQPTTCIRYTRPCCGIYVLTRFPHAPTIPGPPPSISPSRRSKIVDLYRKPSAHDQTRPSPEAHGTDTRREEPSMLLSASQSIPVPNTTRSSLYACYLS